VSPSPASTSPASPSNPTPRPSGPAQPSPSPSGAAEPEDQNNGAGGALDDIVASVAPTVAAVAEATGPAVGALLWLLSIPIVGIAIAIVLVNWRLLARRARQALAGENE
jgi:hypothetical protein